MLDDIRQVCRLAIDARFVERLVEEPTRGPDEGRARQVLAVPWLLSDHDEARVP